MIIFNTEASVFKFKLACAAASKNWFYNLVHSNREAFFTPEELGSIPLVRKDSDKGYSVIDDIVQDSPDMNYDHKEEMLSVLSQFQWNGLTMSRGNNPFRMVVVWKHHPLFSQYYPLWEKWNNYEGHIGKARQIAEMEEIPDELRLEESFVWFVQKWKNEV